MVTIRKRLLTVGTVYFDEEPPTGNPVDLIYYYNRSSPLGGWSALTQGLTPIIDLTMAEAELWANIKKDTRYEIRRATEKDGLTYEMWPSPREEILVNEFLDAYHAVFDRKSPALNIHKGTVHAHVTATAWHVSRVCGEEGVPLSWHVYAFGKSETVLVHSLVNSGMHLRGQATGRANRYHHWQDIRWYRNHGYARYDLGGWYSGDHDVKRLNINRFKAEFGGVLTPTYSGVIPSSFRGQAYTTLRTLLLRRANA